MSATSTSQHSKPDQLRAKPQGPREGSVMWAVIQVLDGKRKPMTPAEILAEIQDRRLAKKLAGKTPEASVAARLAVHAAKGLYVERPEKGKYQLQKGVTAKSIASDSPGAKPATSARAKAGGSKGRRTPASRGRRQSPQPKPAQQQQPADDASTPAPSQEEAATA
ncbi:MAG TPA: winged helix-turn-helix domain-containing protein [Gaiellaceae bacterium]|nr:winged helix-turn-helix domain-containing protein [Gaiellaceae bacterium]